MALTDLQALRLKASNIRIVLARETSTTSGTDLYFKLANDKIQSSPAAEVRVAGVLKTDPADYSIDLDQGIVTFILPPAANDEVEFVYHWSLYTEEELQWFLDDAGGDVTVAAAHLLLALAADAARLAKRQTLIGGGGIGQATIDTSVAARELRETAKALLDLETQIGEGVPAESLTNPPWTEMEYLRQRDQSIIRNA